MWRAKAKKACNDLFLFLKAIQSPHQVALLRSLSILAHSFQVFTLLFNDLQVCRTHWTKSKSIGNHWFYCVCLHPGTKKLIFHWKYECFENHEEQPCVPQQWKRERNLRNINILMQNMYNTLQKLMFFRINEHTSMTCVLYEWNCLWNLMFF